MIVFSENIEIAPSKELKEENISFVEKSNLAAAINISSGRSKPRTNKGGKKKTPLTKWTMPLQPEGYLRAGKYNLL